MDSDSLPAFRDLGLPATLLQVLADLGYEAPTPIQAQTIPPLLAGRDLMGQAQTGTGKTAAFALPLLASLALERRQVQALVLTPTRELSLQVAEALHTYARYLGRVDVLPVYGASPSRPSSSGWTAACTWWWELRAGSWTTCAGEASTSRRFGWWCWTRRTRCSAWASWKTWSGFSPKHPPSAGPPSSPPLCPRRSSGSPAATCANPVLVEMEHRAFTVPAIDQRYLNVAEKHKLEALTRVLEMESGEAVLVFARTKVGAAELCDKLLARGYAAEALHGDLGQVQREAVLRRLRAVRWRCWWPRTWQPAGSTWSTSAT